MQLNAKCINSRCAAHLFASGAHFDLRKAYKYPLKPSHLTHLHYKPFHSFGTFTRVIFEAKGLQNLSSITTLQPPSPPSTTTVIIKVLEEVGESWLIFIIVFRRGKFVHQPHDNKKNFRKVREDKKEKEDRRCFKCGDPNHFISDCPKHSFNDQKAFVVGCWSDSEEDTKKDQICLMAHDTNEVRLKVKLELDEWIKDNGCSRHMTGNKDLFSSNKAIYEAYFLWRERNDRLFKKGKNTVDHVIGSIKSSVRLKLLSCRFKKSKAGLDILKQWNISEALLS
ncbi:zf-CCHC domain-containing protein [Tanacetum coccineum]